MAHFKNITSLLLLFPALSVAAQDSPDLNSQPGQVRRVAAFLAAQITIPSAAMKPAVDNRMGNLGFGGALAIYYNPFKKAEKVPVWLGGEFGYSYYGRFLSEVNVNGVRGNYKTVYGMMQLNAALHLQSAKPAPVKPFLDLIAGGNFYLSEVRENLSAIESALGIEPIVFDNFSSAGFNKGIAVGFSSGKWQMQEENAGASFYLRLSYNWGPRIRYVVRNSLRYESGSNTLRYDVSDVPVRYLNLQLGIGF